MTNKQQVGVGLLVLAVSIAHWLDRHHGVKSNDMESLFGFVFFFLILVGGNMIFRSRAR